MGRNSSEYVVYDFDETGFKYSSERFVTLKEARKLVREGKFVINCRSYNDMAYQRYCLGHPSKADYSVAGVTFGHERYDMDEVFNTFLCLKG